ncbi:hypothetical protein AAG570_001318, partial [Ranatra chinensis]
CSPNPCGSNTQCFTRGSRPVCSCLPGYWGNPLAYCQLGECAESRDCTGNKVCKDYRCVEVCSGQCGRGAQCTARAHVPVCSCPPGTTGDPLVSCRTFDPQELCRPSPCGANTKCDVVNGVPTCSCLDGYVGAPLTGCRHECDSELDCPPTQQCHNFKCAPACTGSTCAPNAICDVRNHRPVCTCSPGTFGDPYTSCNYECQSHYDCPDDRPACSAGKCIDPCIGVCGVGADCRVKLRTTPVCSCPRDMTGDPFVRCRPFDKTDLCVPNPCGSNAECTPGHDNTGRERPVCTCRPGFLGDPLAGCRRGECTTDQECRFDQNCINYECKPSCSGGQCGQGAQCNARNHVAVCSCPPGYTGQPLKHCYEAPKPVAATHRDGRVYYTK